MDAETRRLLAKMAEDGFIATWSHMNGGKYQVKVARDHGDEFVFSVTGECLESVVRLAAEQVVPG